MSLHPVTLPKLNSVRITNFSLYSGVSEVRLDFDKPAFCLAGANGLGKSTFLNCVLFGMTGIVRESGYQFSSVEDFVKDNDSYAKRYFSGRITESDRSLAEIEVSFSLAGSRVTVRRDFLRGGKVSAWRVEPNPAVLERLRPDSVGYQEAVESLSGLSFSQFCFVCHYILSFDENRDLLFWNTKVLTRGVFIMFGADPQAAADADSLARKIERVDSRVRNLQWDITKTRTYIKNLQSDLKGLVDDDAALDVATAAEARHKELLSQLSSTERETTTKRHQSQLLMTRIAEMTASQYSLRVQYDQLYSSLFKPDRATLLTENPVIRESLEKARCGLCGSEDPHVSASIKQVITQACCPLCTSKLSSTPAEQFQDDTFEALKRIDKELIDLDVQMKVSAAERVRLDEETNDLARLVNHLQLEISNLETDPAYVRATRAMLASEQSESLQNVIAVSLERIKVIMRDKDQALRERNKLVQEANAHQQRAASVYANTEREFLPLFQNLAQKFTGLPVTISMRDVQRDKQPQFELALEIQDSSRHFDHQLSESQRFFLDIALRMAFIQHVARSKEAMLLLDTPEGSLDIAYEVNAGEMLGEFILSGHQLVFTANINSSGLVKALARECGRHNFELHRMIDWAILSDVQLRHLNDFDIALDAIERELEGSQ